LGKDLEDDLGRGGMVSVKSDHKKCAPGLKLEEIEDRER